MPELEKGDFVYQNDFELFLVCIGETEESYRFAVHGWRNIDKERVGEYIDHKNGELNKQEDIKKVVKEHGDDDQKEHFEELLRLFSEYSDANFSEDGPHTDFALEDGT